MAGAVRTSGVVSLNPLPPSPERVNILRAMCATRSRGQMVLSYSLALRYFSVSLYARPMLIWIDALWL